MNRLITSLTACFMATGAFADTITVSDAYVRVAGPIAKAAAAFMTLENNGKEDDRLIAASVVDVARKVELHTHIDQDGIMMMREVEAGFLVPAGGQHLLERGGDHVMIMGLTQPLNDGDTVTLTLDFETAPDVTLTLDVRTETGHGAKHN